MKKVFLLLIFSFCFLDIFGKIISNDFLEKSKEISLKIINEEAFVDDFFKFVLKNYDKFEKEEQFGTLYKIRCKKISLKSEYFRLIVFKPLDSNELKSIVEFNTLGISFICGTAKTAICLVLEKDSIDLSEIKHEKIETKDSFFEDFVPN